MGISVNSDMPDIYFRTLVMHIVQGLLASQTDDRKYIDRPDKKKEECLAEDAIIYANAIMRKFSELKL